MNESLNDALVELVKALGGSKVVGSMMRPEMLAEDAGRWLRDCLNPKCRDVLSPERLLLLLRLGREHGCHAAMSFIGSDVGYSTSPIAPEDENAQLMREFIAATRANARIAEKLERAGLLKAVA